MDADFRVYYFGTDPCSVGGVRPELFTFLELGNDSTEGRLRTAEQLRGETARGYIDTNMLVHVSKDPRNEAILGFNLMQLRLNKIAERNWAEANNQAFNAFIRQVKEHDFDDIIEQYREFVVGREDQNCAIPIDGFFSYYGISEHYLYEIDVQVYVYIVIEEVYRAIEHTLNDIFIILSARLNSQLILLKKGFEAYIAATENEITRAKLFIAQQAISELTYVWKRNFIHLLRHRDGICECFVLHANKTTKLRAYLGKKGFEAADMSNRELTYTLQDPETRQFFIDAETKRFNDRVEQIFREHYDYNHSFNNGQSRFQYLSLQAFYERLYADAMSRTRDEPYSNNILRENLSVPRRVFLRNEFEENEVVLVMPDEI